MTNEKLDMLKSLMTWSHEIIVNGETDTSEFSSTLDEETFEFVRDLILDSEIVEENPQTKGGGCE